jgi:hypothetical protein
MRFSLIILSAACWAAPTISNEAVDNITAHGARFAWSTNVASTTAKIKVGLADPPTTTITLINDTSLSTHVGFASGLTAGTLYYWQVCSTNAGETCTASGSFTTLAAAPGIATPPTDPTAVTTTYPTINGTTYNVASDCSDLQSSITTAAAQDGNLNHAVVIPAGTECVGRYVTTAKTGSNPTGSGFIVIMSAGTLPPAGSRVTSGMVANYATIVSNYLYTYYQASDPATCNSGDILIRTDTYTPKLCTGVNIWTSQTRTAGSGAPSATCTEGDWYLNTAEVDTHKAFWWCTQTNKNRNLYVDNNNNFVNWAGIYTPGSAKGYRITGIGIQDLERPAAYYSLLSTSSGTGDEIGSKSFCLAYTQSTDSYIFFDRVYWNGQGQPHRQQEALCFFDGSYVAVIDSFVNNINTWRPTSASESTTHGIFFLNGGGPVKIWNNYFLNTSGMAVFASDDNPVGQTNDVTVERNHMFISPSLNLAEATSNGKLYYFRHHVEQKRGARWKIKGNIFNGGFPSANPNAASIGLTPRNGSSTATQCRTNTIQISDVNVESNKFLYVPMPLLLTGHNDGAGCNTYGTIRFSFVNNLVYTTGKSSTGETDGPGIYDYNGQVSEIGLGLEDTIISNNSFNAISSACCNAHFLNFGGDWSTWPNSRLAFENNMYFSNFIGFTWSVSISSSGTYGTAALNQMVVPNSTYSYNGNGRQRGQTGGIDKVDAFPGVNYSSQTASDFTDAVYRCITCGDEAAFRPLYSGKFAAASSTARGYNGKDAGPDFDALDAALGLTYNLRHYSVTSSGATVAYMAPDTTACTVEYGTSATALTGSRTTDTPAGSRFRTVSLSGLTTATTYYYRVYCGVMVEGNFVTQ